MKTVNAVKILREAKATQSLLLLAIMVSIKIKKQTLSNVATDLAMPASKLKYALGNGISAGLITCTSPGLIQLSNPGLALLRSLGVTWIYNVDQAVASGVTTMGQLTVLEAVKSIRTAASTRKEIGDKAHISYYTTNDILWRLEQNGLVERVNNSNNWTITKEGKAVLKAVGL